MRNTEENNSILHIENILKLGREKKCAETDTVIGPVCAVCYEGVCSVLWGCVYGGCVQCVRGICLSEINLHNSSRVHCHKYTVYNKCIFIFFSVEDGVVCQFQLQKKYLKKFNVAYIGCW